MISGDPFLSQILGIEVAVCGHSYFGLGPSKFQGLYLPIDISQWNEGTDSKNYGELPSMTIL